MDNIFGVVTCINVNTSSSISKSAYMDMYLDIVKNGKCYRIDIDQFSINNESTGLTFIDIENIQTSFEGTVNEKDIYFDNISGINPLVTHYVVRNIKLKSCPMGKDLDSILANSFTEIELQEDYKKFIKQNFLRSIK